MAFDRAATFRHAEKLLTQGKLDLGEVDLGEIENIPTLPVNRPDRAGKDLSIALSEMELQADAGVHRDVAARFDRLASIKARG